MPSSKSPQVVWRHTAPKSVTFFQRPDNCRVNMCSAIAMYEQELERHRVTESKLRESLLRESDLLRQKDELIQQKDILGKESEHRLLNGLQLITSLLAMQSRGCNNSQAAAQLTIAANRVATLGRIHRHLHTLDTLECVEFKQYLEKLCHDLADMASNESQGRCICVEGVELVIPSVKAIPLGFIASELITNSIKHANGKITVGLQTTPNGNCALSVSNDGPGLPDAFDPAATHGLGMKIITALVKEVHGELHFTNGDSGQGTRFFVTFKPRTEQD